MQRRNSGEAPEAAKRAGPAFVGIYALAYASLWLALLTPAMVTLALRVGELAPTTGMQSMSTVLASGAVVALISNPLFGYLSDRTRSRFGRRRPWMIGGMVLGAAALGLVAVAPTLDLVLVGWCLAQLAFNGALAAMVAVLPDRVPPSQRGTVAGILGVCMPIGVLVGAYLVNVLFHSIVEALLVPAAIGIAGTLLLVFVLKEVPVAGAPAPGLPLLTRLRQLDPRKHPDFSWAWSSKFFFAMGTSCLSAYQPYFLIRQLGFEFEAIPSLILQSTLVHSTLLVASSLLCGKLSDTLGRRKPFVFFGAALYGVGLLIIAVSTSYPLFLLGIAAAALGNGTYVGVDLALVTDVLPDQEHGAARDLGVLNITNTLPQVIVPTIAPFMLAAGDGSYFTLFVLASLLSLLGAVLILPVRRIR